MRVNHGRGVLGALCALLLTGTAAAQNYSTMNSPVGYGVAAPAARQVSHADPAVPRDADSGYSGSKQYYSGPQQSPAQSPVQAHDPYDIALNGGWSSCESGYCDQPRWFGSAGAVFLSRIDGDFKITCGCNGYDALMYNDAGMPTSAGPSITLGRYLGCEGCYAIQGVYWGLFPGNQSADLYGHGQPGIGSAFDWSGIGYTDVLDPPAADVFDNAQHYRLQRDFEMHNVEVNFLTFSTPFGNSGCGAGCASGACSGCGSNFRYSFLAGFRYMNFRESMLLSADRDDYVWGNSNHELHYQSEVKNRLAGFQIGARADYQITSCFSAYASAKGGVYGNDMAMSQSVYNDVGYAVVTNSVSSNLGRHVNIHGSEKGVSFLSEFSVGATWDITRCWSLYAGYQVMVATGIAEVGDQIPQQFYQLQENSYIKNDGVLILHGAYAGISYNF
jgi:hypothetical protein